MQRKFTTMFATFHAEIQAESKFFFGQKITLTNWQDKNPEMMSKLFELLCQANADLIASTYHHKKSPSYEAYGGQVRKFMAFEAPLTLGNLNLHEYSGLPWWMAS